KFTHFGNFGWSQEFEFTYESVANSVTNAADGHLILCGTNSIKTLFMKLNLTLGSVMECKSYQASPGISAGFQIERTSDDGFIIVGENSGFGAGVKDISLLKVDEFGGVEWNKSYGGFYNETKPSLSISNSGFVISASTESFGSGLKDVMLFSTSNSGALQWSTIFVYSNDNIPGAVFASSDGCFFIHGTTQNANKEL